MSKLSLAGASLIAAIPGLFLAWVLVSGMLANFGNMSGGVQGIAIFALLLSALAILLPPGMLVFGPKSPAAEKEKKKDKVAEEAADELEEAGDVHEAGASSETLDVASNEVLEAGDLSGEAMTAEALDTFDVEEEEIIEEDEKHR